MGIRHLVALALCAALLGLAASALVRVHCAKALAKRAGAAVPGGAPEPVSEEMVPDHDPSSPPEPESVTSETSLTSSSPSVAGTRRSPRGGRSVTTRKSGDAFAQELARGIRKLGDRRYEIDRDALDLALRNLGLLAGSVRVMPESREGKQFGFRLFAIRASGPIAKLGLHNDDVLVSVNGLDITTADRVLDAYGKLKSADRLVLGLVRGGQPIAYEYAIR